MNEPLLGSAEAVAALAARLSRVSYVDEAPSPHDEPPPWTIADSLGDMNANADGFSELGSALEEIRLGLQHVVYHLATTPWSRSLIDDAPPLFEAT